MRLSGRNSDEQDWIFRVAKQHRPGVMHDWVGFTP